MGLLDFRDEHRSYEQYKLKSNPFPHAGIPDDRELLYVDREKELKIIEDVIKSALRGHSSHLLIIGNYGNGKTHTLRYIKQQLESQRDDVIAVYISNPGDSFTALYSRFFHALGLKTVENLIWLFLEKISGVSDLKEKVHSGETLLPELLKIAVKKICDIVGYEDFATTLLKFILDDYKLLSWRYITGESLSSEQRKVLDVISNIDSDDKALRAFIGFKRFTHFLGFKLMCILIDEFESVQALHPRARQRLLNGIRHIIDLSPIGLCLIIACSPEAWSSIFSEYHAFSERIFRKVILRPLTKDEAYMFITSYLSHQRTQYDHDDINAIYPFTEDAIELIYRASEGNVRRLLMICNQAIDAGLNRGCPILNADVLRRILPDVFIEYRRRYHGK